MNSAVGAHSLCEPNTECMRQMLLMSVELIGLVDKADVYDNVLDIGKTLDNWMWYISFNQYQKEWFVLKDNTKIYMIKQNWK